MKVMSEDYHALKTSKTHSTPDMGSVMVRSTAVTGRNLQRRFFIK